MNRNLQPGNIIRNYPVKDGSFDVFEIRKIEGDVLTVNNTDPRYISEDETWQLNQVELFTFQGTCGSYSIGDTVRAMGYEGTWKVEHFAQDPRSSSQGEINASLVREDGRTRMFYPAHYVKKA